MGKSFEIRPTGIAHAELFLPEKLGPDYPKAKGHVRSDRVVEHYSWKKVTTNVSGFILGSPTIDHYGEMTVSIVVLSRDSGNSPSIDNKPSHGRPMCIDFQASRLARQGRL